MRCWSCETKRHAASRAPPACRPGSDAGSDGAGAGAREALAHRVLLRRLAAIGGRLVLRPGPAARALPALLAETGADAVYANAEIGPFPERRDREAAAAVEASGGRLRLFADELLVAPDAIATERGDPYTVFTPYHRSWDRARIPDPGRLLAELHREGFRSCLWINPYVSVQSRLYREGATRGYFLRRPDGTTYEAVVWNPRSERGMGLCAIVDFTNPDAVRWFRAMLDAQLALGADSFKPDFAEEIPEDARFHDGLTGIERHNPYPLLYQREAFEAVRARAGRAVVWSRSAAPGVQRYPGHWAGDSECTFTDLASTLRGGLAAALSGLAYWSHDIGGFWGDPSPELFVRWTQLGLLSALSRYHGATPRDPWLFGDEALTIFRTYARLRSRLSDHLRP